ncbi:hypothetical protein H5410_045558 [Solanum commersonii]|uniref:Uncharacterized protein n=1 Tax=Solanum commersonii TaxID=4109 RepID=A0A9J5XD35_SOLCO|nr:hypothetical protein H5410_045558 [Solanum commersonii]
MEDNYASSIEDKPDLKKSSSSLKETLIQSSPIREAILRDDNRLTSTFTLATLGLDLPVVALSTCRGIPTADASENRASLVNICVDRLGKEIQAKTIGVSSFGLNHGVQR